MNNPNIIEKELSYKIMGILFGVHNKLGGEYQEKYYQRAVASAFRKNQISFEEQIPVGLDFNGENIGKYILDFLIERKIILEIKAVPSLKPIYFRQVRAYLKANNLELGLLANFHGNRLTYKRILYPIRTINSDNSHSDAFVLLAKQAVEYHIKTGKVLSVPDNLPDKMRERAGVFTSIHTKSGELRGCVGTYLPCQNCLAEEIIHNAISAATQDPRFPEVVENELPDLIYSVDILSVPKPVTDISCLNPKTYGLIVSTPDGRRGLLLPNLEGVGTAEQQIEICRQKAGIDKKEVVNLYRFTVERHAE